MTFYFFSKHNQIAGRKFGDMWFAVLGCALIFVWDDFGSGMRLCVHDGETKTHKFVVMLLRSCILQRIWYWSILTTKRFYYRRRHALELKCRFSIKLLDIIHSLSNKSNDFFYLIFYRCMFLISYPSLR